MPYQHTQAIYRCLHASGAHNENSVALTDDLSLALWNNSNDHIHYERPGHHTLSCYLDGGLDTRRLKSGRAIGGGAPERICLMPSAHQSEWLVQSPLRFIHLYISEQHLQQQAEKTLDIDGRLLQLQDQTFAEDPLVATLFKSLILPLNWSDRSEQLSLSLAVQLIEQHLLKHYSSIRETLPAVRGGLSPGAKLRVVDYIECNLSKPLLLADLANIASLSEYHFARMFRQSMKCPPHQYVTQRRLQRARELLKHSQLTLVEIAAECGFSSQGHFNRRFYQFTKHTPGQYRRQYGAH